MSILTLGEQQISVEETSDKDGEYIANLKRLNIGSGQKTMKTDENGLFLGADNFADAPFSVDYDGKVTAESYAAGSSPVNTFAQDAIPTSLAVGDLWVDTNDSNKLYRAASIGADAIAAGEWILYNDTRAADAVLKAGTGQVITGNFNLNTTNVLIDGANKRIVINDGTNDRILIGYLSGKF